MFWKIGKQFHGRFYLHPSTCIMHVYTVYIKVPFHHTIHWMLMHAGRERGNGEIETVIGMRRVAYWHRTPSSISASGTRRRRRRNDGGPLIHIYTIKFSKSLTRALTRVCDTARLNTPLAASFNNRTRPTILASRNPRHFLL